MGFKNILEGFKEMGKTFKTGKGYERRKMDEYHERERREWRKKRKKDFEEKRKALQSEIRRHKKNKENIKNYTTETNPGGRKMKVIRIENKDGTTTIRKTPIYDENEKKSYKKEEGKLTKTISPVKKTDDMSFGEAFKSSRDAGKKEFTWRGSKYNTRTKEEEAKKYEDGGTSDVQRHQSPGFQTMFEVGSKMNLFGGGGPASERAKMRHERKMNRQGAKADRKMVRTEGRQERKGDRLEGRQETRSRRQDRKDQRQDSRLGYYGKGGKTPRIKKKDRAKGGQVDELAYKKKYGVDYADDPNMDRDLPTGIQSEIGSTPKKYWSRKTKTKAGQFISKLVGAKEHDPNKKRKDKEDRTQSFRKKTRKKKNILGKTIIYGDNLNAQDRRSTENQAGSIIRNGPGGRTKSYDIVDEDGKKRKVHFKTQEEADKYFKNIDKDTGKTKDVKLIEGKETGKQGLYEVDNKDGTKTVQYIPEKTKDIVEGTDITGQDRKTVEQLEKEIDADIRDRERHVRHQLTPERKKEIEKQHQQKNTKEEGKLEQEIRDSAKDSPGSGITPKHDALDFSGQSTSNLKNPSKYKDKKTKYVFDPSTGVTTEKVQRRGPAGWVGGYKKTGRELVDEDYIEASEENRKQREAEEAKKPSRKEKRQQNKEDKKQKKEEKGKQSKVAREAYESGKSSYIYNGQEYKINPKVMKGGGTLMEQYNRKYSNGGYPTKSKPSATDKRSQRYNEAKARFHEDNMRFRDMTDEEISEGNYSPGEKTPIRDFDDKAYDDIRGNFSYKVNGKEYKPPVEGEENYKKGGTLMEQYNRKYSNGGIDPEKKDNTRVHITERKIDRETKGRTNQKLDAEGWPWGRKKEKQIHIKRRPMPKKVYKSTQDVAPEFPRKSNIEPNWNKKLSKLTKRRGEQEEGGKSTKRTQRRINREYRKLNPRYNTGGVNMDEDNDGLPIGVDATPSGPTYGPTMPPNFNNNNNQMSIDGNNLGNTTNNAFNGGAQEDETQINNNLNQQDNSMDQQGDSLDQGDMNQQDDSMDQGQNPARPTRAQLRHERKSARQQARADRRMVRTEARQQRKADRLAGRMEKRGRRQDRKDQRQEARISKREDRRARRRGNFHEGGMVKGKKGAGLGIIIMVGRKGNKKRK